jgi:chorismate--pyruvate lyase
MTCAYWTERPPAESRYRGWLLDRGSLTARILARCRAFGVREVRQRFARPGLDEAAVLGIQRDRLALVREVFLYCGGRPLVFAHSVVERRHLRGLWRSLTTMGTKPLGAALFADPRVIRHPLRFRKLGQSHPLFKAACRALSARPSHLWARRSLFTLHGASILVTEVFLPAILEL